MSFEKPSVEARRQFESKLWIGRLYGVYTFDGTLINARLIFVVLMGAFGLVMLNYGLQQSWPNVALICNSAAIYCLVVQLGVRLSSKFTRNDDDNLTALMQTVVDFYQHEELNLAYRPLLTANLKVSDLLLNVYLIVCLLVFSMLNPTAWILSWYTGEFTFYAPAYLPGVDPKTIAGYSFYSSLFIFYTMLIYFCFMTADVIFMFFAYQSIPMIDILCLKLREFGEKLSEAKVSKVLPPKPSTSKDIEHEMQTAPVEETAIIEQHLIDLIKEFNVYNDYVKAAVKFVELTTFTALTFNSMAMALSMVVAIHSSKTIGGVLAMIFFFQVLMPCAQGTLISHQKEKLLNELYALPWYELSLPKQKIFLQFICLCQNSNEFTIPLFGKVSMELLTDVINGVGSYTMYLLKFS